jgi:hypothetical protein
VVDNQTPKSKDSSPIALHQRIEALERSQASLYLRIATLETIVMNLDQASDAQKPRATITPWRVLNTVLVLGLGVYKAAATYIGQTTGPATEDWIVGVFWTLMCVCTLLSLPVTLIPRQLKRILGFLL